MTVTINKKVSSLRQSRSARKARNTKLPGGKSPKAEKKKSSSNIQSAVEANRSDHGDGTFYRSLISIFNLLDRSAIRYCVLHGYTGFPNEMGTDIDCVVDASASPASLASLIRSHESETRAQIVYQQGYYFVLAICGEDRGLNFLILDFCTNCEFGGLKFFDGKRILDGRRRYREFWVPSIGTEFCCYLTRSVLKESLTDTKTDRLSALYKLDPEACGNRLAQLWSPEEAARIGLACETGDWKPVVDDLAAMRVALMRRLLTANAAYWLRSFLKMAASRLRRLVRPPGLNVVMLGPDGAGKSSTIDALEATMIGPFAGTTVRGFAPALHRVVKRGPVRTDQPHALPPRSYLLSMARAGFWLVYNFAGRFVVRWAKTRNTLVLNDRHFIDIFVDPVRYRYGGPQWALHLVRNLTVKPDLILLLDAPAEVLHNRKPELTMAETKRQCREYRRLVQHEENARVIDAAQPFDRVLCDVQRAILEKRCDVHKYLSTTIRSWPID